CIDARDEHAHLLANRISPIAATANEATLGGVGTMKIVLQCRNVHYTGHERVRKLNHQPVIANVHDCGPEHLRISLVELFLKKLELLEPDRFDLSVSRVAFGIGYVLGDRFNLSYVNLRWARDVSFGLPRRSPVRAKAGPRAMHDYGRVSPDRRGTVE